VTVFRFIEREEAHHRVLTMCRLLGVSPSGYWAWRRRGLSARARGDVELASHIRHAHAASRGTYGAPRVHAELRARGVPCSRKRVARLMRREGLVGVHRRRFVRTTERDRSASPAPDLVARDFERQAPDRLWVADITYLPTRAGFLYLAAIVDAWSRFVVGWAMARHLRAELVTAALDMALAQRQPAAGLVHHSDHGTQYTSLAFGRRLREAGIAPSMGSRGDAYDNALAESFFASLETELVDRRQWHTTDEARLEVFDYIELFYNRKRRHSALGYLAPAEFERRYRLSTIAA
jgi:putative transposase